MRLGRGGRAGAGIGLIKKRTHLLGVVGTKYVDSKGMRKHSSSVIVAGKHGDRAEFHANSAPAEMPDTDGKGGGDSAKPRETGPPVFEHL